MIGLERPYFKSPLPKSCDCLHCSKPGGSCGEVRNAGKHCGCTDRFGVLERLPPLGRVENKLDAAVLEAIDDVRTPLRNLVDAFDLETLRLEVRRRAIGCDDIEAQRDQAANRWPRSRPGSCSAQRSTS